ncbi:hypothetical protein ACA910_007843 [Epithemia clementina (nom. ined.)]
MAAHETEKKEASWPFSHMSSMPLPYLLILPIAFVLLAGFGWSQDEYIEDKVSDIWIPTRGAYAQDLDYAQSLGKDRLPYTSFAAMAISRDGENIFTASRLDEIRQRMEKTESTTIDWKGHKITWDDICYQNNAGRGTTYEFPCARLTPMDLFQEARWFFDETDRITWYNEVVRKRLVLPRTPRFGILSTTCAAQCAETVGLRTDPEFAVSQGYDASYAEPLGLFYDIGNMEMNHPCRQCIEAAFEPTMIRLTEYVKGSFLVLAGELTKFLQNGTVTASEDVQELTQRIDQYYGLSQSITRADVEEYYTYSTLRGMYARFGAAQYAAGYNQMMATDAGLLPVCLQLGLDCPPANVDAATGTAALLAHVDGVFSSFNTAGSPFPFWSLANGTGVMFGGSSPVSGSGVDLSGQPESLGAYLDLANFTNPSAWSPGYSADFADPITPDPAWTANVERNPIYKWFMSSLEISDNRCGNAALTGTDSPSDDYDASTAGLAASLSIMGCTKFDVPNANDEGDSPYNKQHFAKMWIDIHLNSPNFLDIVQGEDDPYTWTTSNGCGYSLGGEREPYSGRSDESILYNASRELYFVDEGASLGPIDRHLLLGGVFPPIEEYSKDDPLQKVEVIQTLYSGLLPADILNRVKNCNRPGGPITNMTVEDAEAILKSYKQLFEENWSEGYDDENNGDVQFVFCSDDSGAIGTTGRILRDITLDNGKLMAISICLIALFSVILLVSPDWIESRVLITLIGVCLVVLAFFASLGLAILIGIKINVTLAWTLPFIILGIGVDDVYIVLMALKKQEGYGRENFLRAMREVAVPVSMTSVVNCLMFAVMNISDIPAIYKTATVATICVIALYLSVLFCYPAYCWLDMKRQAAGYRDVLFCFKAQENDKDEVRKDVRQVWLYEKFYYPVMLGTCEIFM